MNAITKQFGSKVATAALVAVLVFGFAPAASAADIFGFGDLGGGGLSGWSDFGYDSGWSNAGYDTGWSDVGYDSGWSDFGYDSGWSNAGYDTGWSDVGYDSGWNNFGYDSGWNDAGYYSVSAPEYYSVSAPEYYSVAAPEYYSVSAPEYYSVAAPSYAAYDAYDVYDVYDVYGYSTAPTVSIPKFASSYSYIPPVSVPVKPVTPQKPVQQVLTPYCNLVATPSTVTSGQAVVVSWTSSYATSAHLSTYGSVNVSGSQTFYPTQVTTYTLTVYGQGGSANCQTTVGVTGGPYIPPYNPPNYQTPTCWITLGQSNYTFPYYQQATLSWGSTNATSASISGIGSVGTSGSQTVYPSGNQTYTMTVYGNGGSANCYTQGYNQPINNGLYCTLSANPSYIQNGQSTYLTWSTNGNATSAWFSDGLGNVNTNGSLTVRPESTRTYTLTVSNGYSTNTCQTTVNVSGSYYNYPYINLTQIPYTGFDLGPIGNAVYFLSLMGLAAAAAYLAVYYRGGFAAVALAALATRQTTKKTVVTSVAAPAPKKEEKVEEKAEFSGDTMVLARSKDGSMPKIVINRS